jgi:hypothetical protein
VQAVGGLLVGFGLIVFIGGLWEGDNGSNTSGIVVASAVALAVLVFLGIKVSKLATAATAAAVPIIGLVGLVMFSSMLEKGQLFVPFLFVAFLYSVAWFLPGFCGRQSMLAGAILFLSFAVVSLAYQSYITDIINYENLYGGSWYGDSLAERLQGVVERSSLLSTLIGVALIAIGWRLHMKAWEAIATIFIAVGVLQGTVGILGYIAAANFGNFGTSLLLTIFGVFLLSVGITTERKATTWIGLYFTVITIIGTIYATTGDNPDPVSVGLLLMVVGGVIAFFLSPFFGSLLGKIPFVQAAMDKKISSPQP